MRTKGRDKSSNVEDRRGQKLRTSGSSTVARKPTFYDGVKPFLKESLGMAKKSKVKRNGPK